MNSNRENKNNVTAGVGENKAINFLQVKIWTRAQNPRVMCIQ